MVLYSYYCVCVVKSIVTIIFEYCIRVVYEIGIHHIHHVSLSIALFQPRDPLVPGCISISVGLADRMLSPKQQASSVCKSENSCTIYLPLEVYGWLCHMILDVKLQTDLSKRCRSQSKATVWWESDGNPIVANKRVNRVKIESEFGNDNQRVKWSRIRLTTGTWWHGRNGYGIQHPPGPILGVVLRGAKDTRLTSLIFQNPSWAGERHRFWIDEKYWKIRSYTTHGKNQVLRTGRDQKKLGLTRIIYHRNP
jgi:hypothetical protein